VSRWSVIYNQLKNRRVIRTGLVYLAFFWGSVEIADLLAGAGMINENLVRWLLLGGVVGFPAVLTLSWFFESPWRERRWFSVLGDVSVILAIGIAALLFAREQWFTSFTRPVVVIIPIEPTDTRADTANIADHLTRRFRMLLASSDEIRVIELHSSQSPLLSDLPIRAKASALHADLLIGGTVNQGNGEIRLNMQLFSADGELLWSERFNDRLIDQAQLQNHVLNEIWPHLPMSGQALKDLRELVVQCEYPAEPEAIYAISSSALPSEDEQLETLSLLIEQNRDNGLLHFARARAYFNAMETAEVTYKPVLQNMAMRDLDQAAFQCPAHPGIKTLRLYHTLQLQTQEDTRLQFLIQFPNESDLRLKLATAYQQSGDIESSIQLAAEAWTLNPLDVGTVCFYRQLLQLKGLDVDATLTQAVENGVEAGSSLTELTCP